MRPEFPIFVLFSSFVVQGSIGRGRRCCAYSLQDPNEGQNLCQSSSDCIMISESGDPFVDGNDCSVLRDSKMNEENKEECLKESAFDDVAAVEALPDIEIIPFLFKGHGPLTGIDIRLSPTQNVQDVDFRIMDTNLCRKKNSEDCEPRCVSVKNVSNEGQLSYDCEIGFHRKSETSMIHQSTNHTYKIDYSLNGECRSLLFVIPEANSDLETLPLLDNVAIKDGDVRIFFKSKNANFTLEVYENAWNGEWQLRWTFSPGVKMITKDLYDISQGDVPFEDGKNYMVSLVSEEKRIKVAEFSHEGKATAEIVISLIILALIGVFGGFVYVRVQKMRQRSVIIPNELIGSQRISPKDVFLITATEDDQHVDVIFDFIRYLKEHCGVGHVYFAPDPESGIKVQENHDPYQWVENVFEEISSSENCYLLFVEAPTPSGKTKKSLYKGVSICQFNLAKKFLVNREVEDVCVLSFPYSDESTIPEDVRNLVKRKFRFPEDFNKFLCRLLGIRKKLIFPPFPYLKLRPLVLPQNVKNWPDGEILLEKIESLREYQERRRIQGTEDGSANQFLLEDKEVSFS